MNRSNFDPIQVFHPIRCTPAEPFIALSTIRYAERLEQWFAKVESEPEPPNEKQMAVLHQVRHRVLVEFALKKEGDDRVSDTLPEISPVAQEEPLRGLVHGLPGTGKSKLIEWTRRLFTEALAWEHGVHFLMVAFQNRVALAMGGTTLHSGGDLPRPGDSVKKLSHSDIDNTTALQQIGRASCRERV